MRSVADFLLCLSADDQPLITPKLWRNIAGQAVFQLVVMYALVTQGDALFGVPNHAALWGAPSEHYTIVFNAFVLMQLFNQVHFCIPFKLCTSRSYGGIIGCLCTVSLTAADVGNRAVSKRRSTQGRSTMSRKCWKVYSQTSCSSVF